MSEEDPSTSDSPKIPKKFWHLFVLYPSILLSIGSGIPTVWKEYKAWRLGINSSNLQIAAQQEELWERNVGCLSRSPVYTVVLSSTSEIGVTLCGTGDALLRYKTDEDTITYTWVAYPKSRKDTPSPALQEGKETSIVYGVTQCVFVQKRIAVWVRTPGQAQSVQ
jgi:hypothetical protein